MRTVKEVIAWTWLSLYVTAFLVWIVCRSVSCQCCQAVDGILIDFPVLQVGLPRGQDGEGGVRRHGGGGGGEGQGGPGRDSRDTILDIWTTEVGQRYQQEYYMQRGELRNIVARS